jgi:ESS family glutamate:Na+ symporter
VGPEVLGAVATAVGGGDAPLAGGLWPAECLSTWSALPRLLISVVCATLFLGVRIPRPRTVARSAGPQLALGVTIASGRYVVGLLLAVLVLVPLFGLDPMVGALIEVGFERGPRLRGRPSATCSRSWASPRGQDLALVWRPSAWSPEW